MSLWLSRILIGLGFPYQGHCGGRVENVSKGTVRSDVSTWVGGMVREWFCYKRGPGTPRSCPTQNLAHCWPERESLSQDSEINHSALTEHRLCASHCTMFCGPKELSQITFLGITDNEDPAHLPYSAFDDIVMIRVGCKRTPGGVLA